MNKNIKLLFVGDTYIDENFFKLDKNLEKIINKHNFVCCNFEGPLFDLKQKKIIKAGPHLSQNIKAVHFLLSQGFNLFNISNNHIMDYGKESLEKTISVLPDKSYFGAGLSVEKAYKPIIKEYNNKKIGFLSFSEWGFGVLDNEEKYGYTWINHPCVKKLIYEAKKKVDFLIIQVHAGVEEIDLPLPEWRQKYKELIDLGADIIIGHHPHVPQGWEKYHGKYIFYSLGNFYMDRPKRKYDKSFILSLSLDMNLDLSYNIIPIIKEKDELKLLDSNKYVYNLNQKLNSDSYINEINKICIKLWDNRYKKYYFSALNSFTLKLGLIYFLKTIKRLIFKNNIDNTLLLHNLKIESHLFCVQRYLKIIQKNENKKNN